MLVIVPDVLRDAINAKLDAAFAACPDAAKDRDAFYQQLLAYFNANGVVLDFTLERREPQPTTAPTEGTP